MTSISAKLAKAGFDDIDIEPTRVYSIEDARAVPGRRRHRRGRHRAAGGRQIHERVYPRRETGKPAAVHAAAEGVLWHGVSM